MNKKKAEETEHKSNISQTLSDNMNISSHKKLDYKYFSKEVQKQLKELNEFDNKINELLFKKITQFEDEINVLTDKNRIIQIQLKLLNKSIVDAQKGLKKCEENYKMLKVENNNLLAEFQTIKNVKENNDADFLEDLTRNKNRNITEEINHNKNVSSNFFNEGLLLIRLLFYNNLFDFKNIISIYVIVSLHIIAH